MLLPILTLPHLLTWSKVLPPCTCHHTSSPGRRSSLPVHATTPPHLVDGPPSLYMPPHLLTWSTVLPPLYMPPHLLTWSTVLRYILEVWHEVVLGIRGHGHSNTTQISPGVAGHQGVPDTSHHSCEADEGLGVLTVSQVAVALQDGRLHIAG